jgi:hypothetical protein
MEDLVAGTAAECKPPVEEECYLVCPVCLVYLVNLVSFVQPNKQDKPNKLKTPDNG